MLNHVAFYVAITKYFQQILVSTSCYILFQADLKQRAHGRAPVRRTRSDLGGQRLFHWERSSSRRMATRGAATGVRPPSPRKRPPDAPPGDGVMLRPASAARRSSMLRRSLSQPIDIDKLSPLMRAKTAGK